MTTTTTQTAACTAAAARTEINTTSCTPVTTYDGMCAGLVRDNDMWVFEGREYAESTPTEADVLETTAAAMAEPACALVADVSRLVFSSRHVTYTSEVLSAMAVAYAGECDGVAGTDAVVAILQEAARRIAVIEALTC